MSALCLLPSESNPDAYQENVAASQPKQPNEEGAHVAARKSATRKKATKKTAKKKTALQRLEDELPKTLRDYGKQVRTSLNRLERDLERDLERAVPQARRRTRSVPKLDRCQSHAASR